MKSELRLFGSAVRTRVLITVGLLVTTYARRFRVLLGYRSSAVSVSLPTSSDRASPLRDYAEQCARSGSIQATLLATNFEISCCECRKAMLNYWPWLSVSDAGHAARGKRLSSMEFNPNSSVVVVRSAVSRNKR